jgi:hypothetical protein
VLALVRRLGAACAGVVFDWDRTLCSSKAGARPVEGKHRLQPELASLLTAAHHAGGGGGGGALLIDRGRDGQRGPHRPACCVATRNRHGEAIRQVSQNA